jgi:hypothetical protein
LDAIGIYRSKIWGKIIPVFPPQHEQVRPDQRAQAKNMRTDDTIIVEQQIATTGVCTDRCKKKQKKKKKNGEAPTGATPSRAPTSTRLMPAPPRRNPLDDGPKRP